MLDQHHERFKFDLDFMPCKQSLGFEDTNLAIDLNEVEWKRPKDFCLSPSLFSSCDVDTYVCQQGQLGDCWLISACYAAHKFGLINNLFTANNPDFSCEDGCFITVELFVPSNGWIKVMVDDLLPTINNSLVFASSTHPNQLWPAYIEKACAKYFGCYEVLTGGQSSEGFICLTDRYSHRITHLPSSGDKCFDVLCKLLKQPNCVVSVTFHKTGSKMEVLLDHYYMLERIATSSKVGLINLQRGTNTCEYKEYEIDEFDSEEFTVTCMMPGLQVFDEMTAREWTIHRMSSSWDALSTCGGKYDSNSTTYHQNPQFFLSITEPSIVHIMLIQQNKRRHRKGKLLQQAVGVHIWQITSQKLCGKLSGEFLQRNPATRCSTPEYNYISDVVMTFHCGSGNLLIIPSIYSSNITCSLSLKVVTSTPSTLSTLT